MGKDICRSQLVMSIMLLINSSKIVPTAFDLFFAFLLQAKGHVVPTEEDTSLYFGIICCHSIPYQTVSWDTGQIDFLKFW